MRFQIQRWLFISISLLAFAPPLEAQIPGLPAKPAPAAAVTVEKPEEAAARLQQWLKEARAAFARVNDPGAEAQLPAGVDAAALADYRRDLEQTIIGIGRHLKILDSMPQARKELETGREAVTAWTGFDEKPPYSILMIDELVNQRESIQEKAASYQSSLELFGRTLAGIQEEARQGEEASRRLLEDVAAAPGEGGAAQWRLAADRAKSRYLALRATSLQSTVALLQDQAETARAQLSLLDRQLTLAEGKITFDEEDLGKVKQATADRQTALRKEIAGIRKRQQDATVAKARAQVTLDQLRKATPEGTPLEQSPELALATIRMEAAETRVDSLQFVAESLESIDQLESYGPDVYQSRRTLMQSNSKAVRDSALHVLQTGYDRLKSWEIAIANVLAEINADISKQESRASPMAAEDPRLIPINEVRAALWEKQAVMQRVSQSASAQRKMLQRWLGEFEEAKVSEPFSEKLSDAADSAWSSIRRIWTFEIFQYNDTVMIGGLPITEKRGVSLGKFVIALTAFGVAYFLATRINNRLRNAIVRRGHIADAQAKTLGNWLMLVIGFLLAVGTLHFLKIPLTVFAFFGGALAIGLGFGTQTLIKNFICGIIVLFERKVRVGDIVDIGGGAGTITEINTRSSVLRGADGKETLVPNSLFLESRVTNLTLSNRRVRRMLPVRVALGSPPQEIATILKECVERHGLILKNPAPVITFEDFAENAHVFAIYYWTEFNAQTDSDVVASDLRFMIEKRFVEAGIRFPSATNHPQE